MHILVPSAQSAGSAASVCVHIRNTYVREPPLVTAQLSASAPLNTLVQALVALKISGLREDAQPVLLYAGKLLDLRAMAGVIRSSMQQPLLLVAKPRGLHQPFLALRTPLPMPSCPVSPPAAQTASQQHTPRAAQQSGPVPQWSPPRDATRRAVQTGPLLAHPASSIHCRIRTADTTRTPITVPYRCGHITTPALVTRSHAPRSPTPSQHQPAAMPASRPPQHGL